MDQNPIVEVEMPPPEDAEYIDLTQTLFHIGSGFRGVALSELEIGEFETAPADWV